MNLPSTPHSQHAPATAGLLSGMSRPVQIGLIVLFLIGGVFQVGPWSGDLSIYRNAAHAVTDGDNPYLPWAIGESFIYHPITFAVFVPLSVVPRLLSQLLVHGAVMGLFFGFVFWQTRVVDVWWWVLLVVWLPFSENFTAGQIDVFLLWAMVLAWVAAEAGRARVAGLWLALAAIIKLSPVILLAYFALRRQWAVIGWTAISLVALNAVAVLIFGPALLADYIAILGNTFSDPGLDIIWNVSSLAYLSQIFGASAAVGWAHRILFGVALVAYGATLYRTPHYDRRVAYALLMVLIQFFSPLVWLHHLAVLMFALVLLRVHGLKAWIIIGIMTLLQIERIVLIMIVVLHDGSALADVIAPLLGHLPPQIAQVWLMVVLWRLLVPSHSEDDQRGRPARSSDDPLGPTQRWPPR